MPLKESFKWLFLFSLIFLPIWSAKKSLSPPLPEPAHPLIFYSNDLGGNLRQTFCQAIEKATQSISLQIYGLTDPSVISLLQKKEREGINTILFYDPKGSKRLSSFLPQAHPIHSTGLMHKKILVVDREQLWIGTANLTPQSLQFHHNLLVGIWNPPCATFWSDGIEQSGVFEIGGREVHCFQLPDFDGRGLKALCELIDQAIKKIQVAMFTLTHPKLIERLIDAAARGVQVSVAVDRYTAKGASFKATERLREGGVIIRIGCGDALLHHKWALIDDTSFAMGSANWTLGAFSKNQDSLLIFRNLNIKDKKNLNKLWRSVEKQTEKR